MNSFAYKSGGWSKIRERSDFSVSKGDRGQKSQKGVKKTLKPPADGQKSQKGVDFQINFTPFSSFWPKPAYKAEKSTPFSSFWPRSASKGKNSLPTGFFGHPLGKYQYLTHLP